MGLPQQPQRPLLPLVQAIAERADCARSTVAIAIKALEDAGVLTWVNRLVRIRDAEREPFVLQQAVTHDLEELDRLSARIRQVGILDLGIAVGKSDTGLKGPPRRCKTPCIKSGARWRKSSST